MENEEIKTVSIEDFKTNEHIIDYIDDDFAIVNSLEGAPTGNDTVRLGCFLLAICVEGCIQLDINLSIGRWRPVTWPSQHHHQPYYVKSQE